MIVKKLEDGKLPSGHCEKKKSARLNIRPKFPIYNAAQMKQPPLHPRLRAGYLKTWPYAQRPVLGITCES